MSTQDQIDSISNLLIEYSAGNYSFKAPISQELNEIDMIISGINMLGEELESSNVSMEYFTSIFNAVSDLIVVISASGNPIDTNESFKRFFDSSEEDVSNQMKNVFGLAGITLEEVKKYLEKNVRPYQFELKLLKAGKQHYFTVTVSKIINRFDEFKGYLVNLRDISAVRENENQILKAIFTTQQHEQKRVADDLHDSLGQELSMTRLMLSHLKKEVRRDEKALDLVEACNEIMEQSIAHLREICFNLMPGILVRGGLNLAIKDLVKRLSVQGNFSVDLNVPEDFPKLEPNLEIAIYRITQEFINNMIKHSNADKLFIKMDINNEILEIDLSENGQGFDTSSLKKIGESRGYANLTSKTKAFNGELDYNSEIGKGTSIKIKFPL